MRNGEYLMKKNKAMKLCFISSSGGHYQQLSMLRPLDKKYDTVWITESTKYKSDADYYVLQTGSKDWLFPAKMFMNTLKSIYVLIKERPDIIITTGTMVALPICYIGKLFGKKVVFIETFARVTDCTKTGKIMYKKANLFIYQWEQLKKYYPEGVYGGSIY